MKSTDLRAHSALALAVLLSLGLGRGEVRGQRASGEDPANGLATLASGIFSAEPSSTEGALTLLLPVGAQGVGVGRAMTAMQGPETAFWNPAGLARLEGRRFMVYRSDDLAGESTAFSLLLARQPLGTLALSYQLLDLGDQDYRDKDNNVLGSVSFRDHLAIASFAIQLLPRLDTGVNFKVFQSRITCRGQCTDAGVTGTTYALDAGIQTEPSNSIPLRIGVMIAHVGPNLQLINVEQADPLPTRLRAAVAYEVLGHFVERPDVALWMTAELEDRWREPGSPVLYLGGEFSAGKDDMFFLRAGYGQASAGQPVGVSAGLGLNYERLELGVAKRVSGSSISGESEPVYVTFGVVF